MWINKIKDFSFFTDIDVLYAKYNATDWNVVIGPDNASTFKTKKEAIRARKSNESSELSVTIRYGQAKKEYDDWIANGSILQTRESLDKVNSRKYNNESPEKVLDWRLYHAENEHKISYDDYKTWPHLYDVFSHLWSVNRYIPHNDNDPYELTIQISTRRDSSFDKFEKEVNLAYNHITMCHDGFKIYDILDHYLSEGGRSATLCYDRDKNEAYLNERYGGESKHGTLKEIFELMKVDNYYE